MIIEANIDENLYLSKKFPVATDIAPWHEIDKELTNWFVPHYKNIKYRFNNFGYRDRDWNNLNFSESIFCFGCSQTLGVGVEEENTWPKIIEKKLGKQTCNLGITGASNDTISRILLSATNYSKPLAVFCLLTNSERREIFKEDLKITVFPKINEVSNYHKKKYLKEQDFNFYIHNSDSISDQYNKDKNILLIKSWCSSQNIKLILADYKIPIMKIISNDMAADGRHIGKKTHELIANFFIESYNN